MLRIREIFGAAAKRFLPAALGVLATVLVADIARGMPFIGARVQIAFAQSVGLVLGYVTILILLRKRMRADAQVQGRRSLIAGVVAAAASYWTYMVSGAPSHEVPFFMWLTYLMGIGAATGVGGTIAVFFPWLTAAPSSARAAATEASPNGQL